MKDDRLYLLHIQECLARIRDYITGGREEFLSSTLIQDAVIRNLQTLTESTQRLSSTLKAKHRRLDWRGMAAFRNVLVHRYLGINVERVWGVVETDIPVLEQRVKSILKGVSRASAGSAARKKKPKPKKKKP